ncbi:DUF1330 domain-containing protein [Bosea lathyri]|uniref:Uncharacterized conserved protein, DUF1330 family n=1 Tax=Bosea lathyri TaxID=1036778 RepID=A0A1H6CR04_9HYPH|nr:DUF1330 domain-containing protein [Bosea lathyri]SEG75479.1 Uncharacterized conserved protein, DUF1330 family [Bosea lathyri]
MASYAIGRLRDVRLGPQIVAYLERIDATLAPFGGRFLIHGDPPEVLEGAWTGDLIVIAFPDRTQARAWYASPAYRAILPLRTGNSVGDVILIDGVCETHRAVDVLKSAASESAA